MDASITQFTDIFPFVPRSPVFGVEAEISSADRKGDMDLAQGRGFFSTMGLVVSSRKSPRCSGMQSWRVSNTSLLQHYRIVPAVFSIAGLGEPQLSE